MRKKDPGFRYCLFIALSYLAMKYLTRQIGCMLTELAVPKWEQDCLWYFVLFPLCVLQLYLLGSGYISIAFKKGIRTWGWPIALGLLVVACIEIFFWRMMMPLERVEFGLSAAMMVLPTFPAAYVRLTIKKRTNQMPPKQQP